METGEGVFPSPWSWCSLSADTLPGRKGIVWLLLATVAEIPPVVSVADSIMHVCVPHILNPLL